MTDQKPADLADKVRKIVNDMRGHADHDAVRGREEEYVRHFADRLEALLPTPTLPTLAGMAPSKRAACQWMQADVKDHSVRYVIAAPFDEDDDAVLIDADGAVDWVSPDRVIPRPDLPRLEWPEATPTGPDHLAVGTVIESADDPRIDALPVGSILSDCDGEATIKGRGDWTGPGYIPIPYEGTEYGPWTVLHIPKEEA